MKNRVNVYVIIFISLIASNILSSYFQWQSTAITHTLLEAMATFFSLFVGMVALLRYYSKKRLIFLVIGLGFLGTTLLDAYHMAVTATFLSNYFLTAPPSLIRQSWLASPLFLALILMAKHFIRLKEIELSSKVKVVEGLVYSTISLLVLIIVLIFSFVTLPQQVYYPTLFFSRPYELIPVGLYLTLLFIHSYHRNIRQRIIDKWIFIALIIQFNLYLFMARSNQLFDTMFIMAHFLKIGSYISVLTGLLISTYDLFKQAEESNHFMQSINQKLEQEIVERKKIERSLRQSEEKHRTLINNIQDGVFLIQGETLLFVNAALAEMVGYRVEAMIGGDVTQYVAPEDKQTVLGWYRDQEGQEDISAEYEFHLLNKDDKTRILVNVNVGRINYQDQMMAMGTVKNITDHKRMEAELREAYQNLKSLNQQLRDELILAQQIQQGLLPLPRPYWSDIDVICYTKSAHEIGGDFYDYHAFNDHHFAIAVGDVSGKGASAALLMATTLSRFDAALSLQLTPAERMIHLDKAITPYTKPRRQNCAMCYVEFNFVGTKLSQSLEPSPSNKPYFTLDIINAGCIPPYIKRANGNVENPEIGGFALGQGLGAETGYEQHTINLFKGDMVILTSDGVVEANGEDGRLLGFEALEAILQNGPTTGAAALLAHLKQEITAFTRDVDPYDDMTIVVAHV